MSELATSTRIRLLDTSDAIPALLGALFDARQAVDVTQARP